MILLVVITSSCEQKKAKSQKEKTTVILERTANCAFNEDESILYMTSHQYLTRIQLKK